MHFKSCILTLLGATLVNAAIDVCGTPEPTEEQEQLDRRLHAVEADATRNFALPEEIDIDVYGHLSRIAYLLTDTTIGQVLPRHFQQQ
jgi:hypothetical protein